MTMVLQQVAFEIALGPDASLAELRQAREEWLAAAHDDMAACRDVARALGTQRAAARAGWTSWSWRNGPVLVNLYEGSGDWLPAQGCYDRISVLNVFSGSLLVCRQRESLDPQAVSPEDFFVPGRWIGYVQAQLASARDVQADAYRQATEGERLALAQMLLIGQEV